MRNRTIKAGYFQLTRHRKDLNVELVCVEASIPELDSTDAPVAILIEDFKRDADRTPLRKHEYREYDGHLYRPMRRHHWLTNTDKSLTYEETDIAVAAQVLLDLCAINPAHISIYNWLTRNFIYSSNFDKEIKNHFNEKNDSGKFIEVENYIPFVRSVIQRVILINGELWVRADPYMIEWIGAGGLLRTDEIHILRDKANRRLVQSTINPAAIIGPPQNFKTVVSDVTVTFTNQEYKKSSRALLQNLSLLLDLFTHVDVEKEIASEGGKFKYGLLADQKDEFLQSYAQIKSYILSEHLENKPSIFSNLKTMSESIRLGNMRGENRHKRNFSSYIDKLENYFTTYDRQTEMEILLDQALREYRG